MAGTDVRSNHLSLNRLLEDGREMFLDPGPVQDPVQDPVRGKQVHPTALLQVRLMVQLLDYQVRVATNSVCYLLGPKCSFYIRVSNLIIAVELVRRLIQYFVFISNITSSRNGGLDI